MTPREDEPDRSVRLAEIRFGGTTLLAGNEAGLCPTNSAPGRRVNMDAHVAPSQEWREEYVQPCHRLEGITVYPFPAALALADHLVQIRCWTYLPRSILHSGRSGSVAPGPFSFRISYKDSPPEGGSTSAKVQRLNGSSLKCALLVPTSEIKLHLRISHYRGEPGTAGRTEPVGTLPDSFLGSQFTGGISRQRACTR